MNHLYYSNCRAPLYGGLDTFGTGGEELCRSCFLSPMPETAPVELDDYEVSLELEPEIMRRYQELRDKKTPAA